MTTTLTARAAAFALAALMTMGMLGGIDDFARVETRLNAAGTLMALATQAAQPAVRA